MELRRAHRPFARPDLRRRPLRPPCVAAALALAWALPAQAACGAPAGLVRVAEVDERLDVALADGRLVKLAGLDLPTPSRGARATAEEARRFLVERLTGREAEIDLLSTGVDRWGRLLADLVLPETTPGSGQSVAAALIAAGYARVKPEFEARACAPQRLSVEEGARRASLGLWSDPAYAVVAASDAATLRARAGEFVVIEGRVRRVGFTQSRLYLDLVSRDGPTIVLPRKLAPALARSGRPVEEMTGEVVRARGALDDRIRPTIEVDEPAMIEVVRPHGGEQPPR